MRQRFLAKLSQYWPLGFLLLVEIALVVTNYKPGTWLMGWDNVMPEFNFLQALRTNIFGVWIEYRGVGLPDGMGHAANLVHTLFLWLLSFTLPQNTLRYAFHFLMHLTGMVGMYILLTRVFLHLRGVKPAFLGSLFYGLNLITIQMFYTPLEAFSVHFAALPWLAYSLIRYLKQPSRNTLLLFITISILSTPQFFIPTLLLPTAILLGSICLIPGIKEVPIPGIIRRALIPGICFFIINAFWLMPYLYNLPYNAPIIARAKINQMSSGEVYARNQVFGDLKNVLTMRGFMLDFEDINKDGQPIFVMETWRTWLANPIIQLIGFMIAGFIIFGIWKSTWAMGIWLISGIFLANNTPYISTIMNALRDHVPLFAEAYRFPFTKFSLLFGFTSCILAVWGLKLIFDTLSAHSRPSLKNTWIKIVGVTVIAGGIIFQSLPAFQGHFFYDALRVNLPKDYIALFNFMDKRDHSGRISNLPQPSYWSWKHYNYGYVGSGFLWYGLSQPLMDRAFDPWSDKNEQYYWELSHALYSNNAGKLNTVLTKYDIRYIIFDGSLVTPGNNRALIPEETKTMLAALPSIKQIAQFGRLAVYEKTDLDVTTFIRTTVAITSPIDTPVLPKDTSTLVYSSTNSAVLVPQAFKPCGVLKQGTVNAEILSDEVLRMHARNERGCISFGIPALSHRDSYRVSVTWRHVNGRPILFSLINNTAKHVEVETLLENPNSGWHTDYFTLPPLAPDGLGYTVYITNDGIGNTETVNDIGIINFYTLPDQETPVTIPSYTSQSRLDVSHPNPAYYFVKIPSNAESQTLILSQAYNDGWHAFDLTTGKELTGHILVNNWENGWTLEQSTTNIIIFFLPQLLEYAGFALMLVGLLTLAIKK